MNTIPFTKIAVSAVITGVALSGVAAFGTVTPGTPGRDVTSGLDNDNATNTFIQPPGVTAQQHMNNGDVLFGRQNDDLLIGNLGSDTLVAGPGDDIMIGGPDNFTPPNNDVALGETGSDVFVWAPGDGSDAFAADKGFDTMIFANLETRANGSPQLEWFHGRRIPRVDITGQPAQSCQIVPVPARERLGAQFLVRFLVSNAITVTVRQKDVERVLCPSSNARRLEVADLTSAHPSFHSVPVGHFHGTVGAIVAKP
jgi:hypothetical protein